MILSPKIKEVIKIIALTIGLIVDVIMSIICFRAQAADTWSQVAFIAIGVMIVLLVAISYAEGSYKLWLACVIVCCFFDVSYLLQSTKIQANNTTVATDQELIRLTSIADNAALALKNKQAEYAAATKRDTMAELNVQIENARADYQSAEVARVARMVMVESGHVMSGVITADNIFGAIPTAIADRRIIQLIMYGLIVGIIQAMIVFGIGKPEESKGRFLDRVRNMLTTKPGDTNNVPDPIQPEPKKRKFAKRNRGGKIDRVAQWVDSGGWSGKIMDKKEFLTLMDGLGGFPEREYRRIKKLAIKEWVIEPDGKIRTKDPELAKTILHNVSETVNQFELM